MRRRLPKLIFGLFATCCVSSAFATDLSNSVTGSVSDGSSSLPYRLFEPTGLAAGQKAPLVLFLHGMGDRGTDNVAQTDWMGGLVNATKSGQYASYVLAPQIDTHSWFQSFSSKPTEAMQLTIDALKKVINTENIDTSRVYVTGLSMGGMGTWDILAREPQLFAAAVPMSGGADPKTASKIKDIPIWAFHGGADSVVPVSEMRDTIQALKDAGGSPKYTEVAGADHAIWAPIYADESNTLYPWLFGQHLGDVVKSAAETPSAVAVAPEAAGAVVVADVPEPGSITCVALVGMALLGRRRSRRATR
ncbi:MAG: esterase [Phycisphaerales bacterium]|nr:esterase [Phycisphaerales bacterium]